MIEWWGQVGESGALVSGIHGERFLLRDRAVRHATLTRVHLKRGEFEGVDFAHTRFIDCYFRRVTFRRCDFTGAFFRDCDFPKARFVECRFPYSRWVGTRVEMRELLANLPEEWPEVARDLCQSLRANARSQGDGPGSKRLLFRSMKFHRWMLLETILLRKSWYRERFGFFDRVGSFVRLCASWAERLMWGYGESPFLLLVWGVIVIGGFAGYYEANGLSEAIGVTGGTVSRLTAAVEFSALAFVGSTERVAWESGPTGAFAVQGTFGMLFIGVLAAVVYRWISIRQG